MRPFAQPTDRKGQAPPMPSTPPKPTRHGDRAPTLATVARAAGVSRQTVSNALNSPHLLRPDTLLRVQRAIEELGYSPNRAARSLRTRSSRLIGLRVDPAVEDSANALMDRFVHTLVESSEVAGYHVLLFTACGLPRKVSVRTKASTAAERRSSSYGSVASWSPPAVNSSTW